MPTSSMLQHLVLRKAANICGGEGTLSRVLNVSTVDLRRWMEGKAAAPLPVFNEAMKLVNDAYRAASKAGARG